MSNEEIKNLISIFVLDTITNISLTNLELKNLLLSVSIEDLITLIKNNNDRLTPIEPKNIPQFSNIDLLPKVVEVVKNASDIKNYTDLGSYLTTRGAKEGAKQKYGENHYKIAVQLGLTTPTTKDFALTSLGEMYHNEHDSETRLIIAKKLALRIPVIQQGLLLAENGFVEMDKLLKAYISSSTIDRRRSNINTLFRWIYSIAGEETQHAINHIIWR